MSKENLPLGLFNKHAEALALSEPVFFNDENDLFNDLPSPAKSAVVFLPKSKGLIHMTLALLSNMVEQGGKIVLAGANDAGIRSAKDSYEKYIGPVEEKIVGNHSALYVGSNMRLGAGKKIEDFLTFSPVSHGSVKIEIANIAGVFSAGELDEGTKLLLDKIPYDRKKVLDMASGSGVIGAVYMKRNPNAEVVMSDKSLLAVFASKKTSEKNGIEASVVESNVFDSVPGKFDLVLCNPPFHKGVGTDYSFIDEFAKEAKAHLAPGGEVWLVANAFLSYEDTLRQNIGPTEIMADDGKFKVYRSKA